MDISYRLRSALELLIEIQSGYNYNKKNIDTKVHKHLHGWLESILKSMVPDKLCCLYFTLSFRNFSNLTSYEIETAHLMLQQKSNYNEINQLYEKSEYKTQIEQICEEIQFLSYDAKNTFEVLLKRKAFKP